MGKGDPKTRRGKIARGSSGKYRQVKRKTTQAAGSEVKAAKAEEIVELQPAETVAEPKPKTKKTPAKKAEEEKHETGEVTTPEEKPAPAKKKESKPKTKEE